jgi:hypothetical protein
MIYFKIKNIYGKKKGLRRWVCFLLNCHGHENYQNKRLKYKFKFKFKRQNKKDQNKNTQVKTNNTKRPWPKIQIDFHCNEINKSKHKNNITKIYNKIELYISVEHTKSNWGILPLIIPFGDIPKKNFHHYEKLSPQQL